MKFTSLGSVEIPSGAFSNYVTLFLHHSKKAGWHLKAVDDDETVLGIFVGDTSAEAVAALINELPGIDGQEVQELIDEERP